MAHCDAAGVNGSNRILPHGAPQPRMMPNGCLGKSRARLAPVLTEASSWMSDRRRPIRSVPMRVDTVPSDVLDPNAPSPWEVGLMAQWKCYSHAGIGER